MVSIFSNVLTNYQPFHRNNTWQVQTKVYVWGLLWNEFDSKLAKQETNFQWNGQRTEVYVKQIS